MCSCRTDRVKLVLNNKALFIRKSRRAAQSFFRRVISHCKGMHTVNLHSRTPT